MVEGVDRLEAVLEATHRTLREEGQCCKEENDVASQKERGTSSVSSTSTGSHYQLDYSICVRGYL